MPITPKGSSKHESLSPRTKALLQLIQGLLPAMTAILGGLWIVWTYMHDQNVQAGKDELNRTHELEQRQTESRIRLFEAQKPFLDRKMQEYFDTAGIAGKLASSAQAKTPEWNRLRDQFWSKRWSEMEMVGTPKTRERMRAVGEALNILEKKPENDPDRGEAHFLRWMVECLTDELRASMEASWQTEVAYVKPDEPSGCHAGFEEKPSPKFVSRSRRARQLVDRFSATQEISAPLSLGVD